MTETEKRLAELEQMGLVEKTGEYRNGKPVWRATARAPQLDDEDTELGGPLVKRGPVDTHDA